MLFQVHSLVSTKGLDNPQYATSLQQAFSKVMQREGFVAFWKGNGTSCLHRFPYSAINFFVYERATPVFNRFTSNNPNEQDWRSAATRFLSGATAGTTATVACYPLDLIRTRLTTQQPQTEKAYSGITDAVVKIIKYEGPLGLYSGLGTTLGVAVPSFAISYMVYGSLREYVLDDERFNNFRRVSSDGSPRLGAVATLACGATSGALTAVVTYPVDVTRRRMQIQAQYVPVGLRKTAVQHMKDIVKTEGAVGLYRGLQPELLKVVPFVAVMFGVYETLRDHFNLSSQ